MKTVSNPNYTIEDLLTVMQRLRDPNSGCPWDLQQTPQSLMRYTLEECYELIDAIEKQDSQHIAEELGDVLLQVIFYCQLAQEKNEFNFATVVSKLTEKLIRRHPHVFSEAHCENVQAVVKSWDMIKQQERQEKQQQGLFDDVPQALPALMRAQKIQKRAAQVQFDFSDTQQVLVRLKEELGEFEQALCIANQAALQDELGDILFSVANLARHLELQAELCLHQANGKFVRRMQFIEQHLQTAQQSWLDLDAQSHQQLWHQAKLQVG